MASNDLRTATGAKAITPSDATVLDGVRALYIGGAGDVAVMFEGGNAAVTFVGAQAGSILDVQAVKVMATGTTATSINALF